jgi:glycosyltransferase involved in cell wall biosynthesis
MELTMMYKADISYFPSYVEIDVIHSIDASIRAKAISLYVYDTFLSHIEQDFAKREDIMFVGGFAHPPNADGVLWFAKEVFPKIRARFPEVKFYVAGSKVTDEIRALEQPGNGIIIKGFVTDEELSEMYAKSKVAVVPLRYGAGVKGKVLEALYNGIPLVTTNIGAEGIPFVGTALEISDDPEGFAEKVIGLYGDNERCRQLSVKTQEYIKEHFSLDGAWKIIEEDFS